MKNMSLLLLAMLVLTSVAVSAVNLEISSVEINGRDRTSETGHATSISVERGEKLDITVGVQALDDVEDVQIEAVISGYRYSSYEEDKVSDTTRTFSLDQNDTDEYDLQLEVPMKIDTDYFKLRIRVSDRDDASVEQTYQLHIKGVAQENAVQIRDIVFSPDQIVAGRAVTANVKVKNYGSDDLTDITVRVDVPDLHISDSEFLDQLDADETRTFEELLLRIPQCTEPGTYDVKITVEFDEFEETSSDATLTVVKGDCPGTTPAKPAGEDKTVITLPQKQEVRKGTTGTVYPIMIQNNGPQAVSYVLTIEGVSWGTYRIEPSSVLIVPAGEAKTAYLYVTADDKATEGDQLFTVTVDANGETKQVALTASVTPSQASGSQNIRRGLEIALIVLVIVLIIVGLIVGFMKLREGNKEEAQTYY